MVLIMLILASQQSLSDNLSKMNHVADYFKSFSPEAWASWATFIIALIGISVTIWQLKKNFRLKKQAETFEELSKNIRNASESSRQIADSVDSIIGDLGTAADDMNFNTLGKTDADFKAEINRRSEILDALQKKFTAHTESIRSNALNILKIIKDIEKSTVVKERTRVAARYLFYETSEQHELMGTANAILATIQVVPAIGKKPNIPPETFKAIRSLVVLIGQKDKTISGYLNDLEIILHNDLVKEIYGKAKNETLPVRHLSDEGLRDNRTKSPLL